jgi:hypothetical protein
MTDGLCCVYPSYKLLLDIRFHTCHNRSRLHNSREITLFLSSIWKDFRELKDGYGHFNCFPKRGRR